MVIVVRLVADPRRRVNPFPPEDAQQTLVLLTRVARLFASFLDGSVELAYRTYPKTATSTLAVPRTYLQLHDNVALMVLDSTGLSLQLITDRGRRPAIIG
jgi:hypothetical protein